MDAIFLVIAALGALLAVFWIAATFLGMFGNKTRLGIYQLRKILSDFGVDPNDYSNNQLQRASENALSVATWSGPVVGKYDATEYMGQLKFGGMLLAAHAKGKELDQDFQ